MTKEELKKRIINILGDDLKLINEMSILNERKTLHETKLFIYDKELNNELELTFIYCWDKDNLQQIAPLFSYKNPYICFLDYLLELGQKITLIQDLLYKHIEEKKNQN